MEKKKEFTVQEIILGLRKEYKDIDEKLFTLTNFCIGDKKIVSGYRFDLSRGYDKNVKIICQYKNKENLFQKIIRKMLSEDKIIQTSNIINTTCYVASDGNYKINDVSDLNKTYNCPVQITDVHKEHFTEDATNIIESDFVSNINQEIITEKDNIICKISMSLDSIQIYIRSLKSNEFLSILYLRATDELYIDNFTNKKISSEYIEKILKINIPKEELSSYHISSINESKIVDKNISLVNFDCRNKATITINENNNEIILRKVKRN